MQSDKILSRNLIIKRSRKSSKKRSRRSSRKRSRRSSRKRSRRSSKKRSRRSSKKRSRRSSRKRSRRSGRKRSKRSKRNKHIKNKSNIFINLLDGADKRKREDDEESPIPVKKPKDVESFINKLEQADVIQYYNNIIKYNILQFDETNNTIMNTAANNYLSKQAKFILKSKIYEKYEDVPEDIINLLISKLGNLYGKIKSKTVIYENGDLFIGKLQDNLRNGEGIMFYSNGDKYEGGWVNDIKQGVGKLITKVSTYEGDWVNDREEGTGKMIYHQSGEIYEGEWVNGSREGKGLLIFNSLIRDQNIIAKMQKYSDVKMPQNKNFHYGDWVNDVERGQGVRLNEDFASIGDFRYGSFRKGVMIYKEGVEDNYTEFLGNFTKTGECKIIYPNGSIFEGFRIVADDEELEEEIIEYGIITTIEGEKSISTTNLDNELSNLQNYKKYFDGTFVYPDFKIIRDYPVFESNFDNFKLLLTHLSAENNKDLREICKFGDKICKADEKILSKHSKYFKWYFSNNNTRNSETLSLIFYNDQNVCEKILYYLYFGEFANDKDGIDDRLLQIIKFLRIDTKPGWYIDYLWKNKTYFENDVRVIFKSRDRSIKAHVSILCNNSPYFATAFSDRWKYDEVAVLEEFTSEIFDNDERSCEKILYYLYFGKFEIIKDNKNEKLLKILDFLHVKTSPDIIVQIDGSSRMTKKKENKYVLQGDEK